MEIIKNKLAFGAVLLITGCTGQQFPKVVDTPYCDANTTRPAVELTQVERTDSTTELTFMAMYDYHDIIFQLGDDINLVTGDIKAPVKRVQSIGNTVISNNNVIMPQGIPVQFKLIFPALPENVATFDFVQKNNKGDVTNSIWGIDLTGRRLPDQLPAEIPAKLLEHDLSAGPLPQIVEKDGVARVTAHAVAWRDWMDRSVSFVVNTIDDTQQIIESEFDEKGIVTVDIPLRGTASILAITPYNTYASFYVDPGEDINLYILPNNSSMTQRFIRPSGVNDGKYRNLGTMSNKLISFNEYADTLLLGKTNPNEYFAAMMEIHRNGLDSIKARNFAPDMEKYARSYIDLCLMAQTLKPDAYIPRDWDQRDSAKADTVSRFTSGQIKQIRSCIDFDNPLLELKSIGNPGSRSTFLKARDLILAE